jgi:dephospho-CoA kinase
MRNIAIVGRFCAGKTTLAEELVSEYGFERVSMAANLKAIVADAYGTSDKSAIVDVTLSSGAPGKMSMRQVLQAFGENAKGHDRHFWLRWFLRDTEMYADTGIPLVMDDVRLQFEAEYLRDNNWFLVRVEAPKEVRLERYEALYGKLPTQAEMSHKTETESDLIRVDLVLDSTLSPALLSELVFANAGGFPSDNLT